MLTYPRLADPCESLTPCGTYCLRQSITFITYSRGLVNCFFAFSGIIFSGFHPAPFFRGIRQMQSFFTFSFSFLSNSAHATCFSTFFSKRLTFFVLSCIIHYTKDFFQVLLSLYVTASFPGRTERCVVDPFGDAFYDP